MSKAKKERRLERVSVPTKAKAPAMALFLRDALKRESRHRTNRAIRWRASKGGKA
jgi:hypothetical protein